MAGTTGVHISALGGYRNAGGITPTTSMGVPSTTIFRPTTARSAPNRRCQRP